MTQNLIQQKIKQKGPRYVIMDIETHKPLRKLGKIMQFHSITAVNTIFYSLKSSGLQQYYCIYDNHKGKIIK